MTDSRSAFLSGLGRMGTRHLLGLTRGGFEVWAVDPRQESRDRARGELEREGLFSEAVHFLAEPIAAEFDVAIFAETAAHRIPNLRRFLERSTARRLLLEKPLGGDPGEVEDLERRLGSWGGDPNRTHVNFARRRWPFYLTVRELCRTSSSFSMTVSGGAFGFGCNGIHYLDTFLWLSQAEEAEVEQVRLAPARIPSGRGPEFEDYGGTFQLRTAAGSLWCEGLPSSSSPTLVGIRGDHFYAWMCESDLTHRIAARRAGSEAPNYLCGVDYETLSEGVAQVPSLPQVTADWATVAGILPVLRCGLRAHELLHSILREGGAPGPHRYT